MGRQGFRLLSLALTVALAAASPSLAQEEQTILPISAELPTIPTIDVPLEPVSADVPKFELQISPNTQVPKLEAPKDGNIAITQLALESTEYIDFRYVKNSQRPDDMGLWEHFRTGSGEQIHRLFSDYKNFYLSENLIYVGVAIAVAAPIANTHADQGIRDWYQRGAGNSQGANDTATFFKAFGEWQYALPVYFGLSLTEHIFPDSPVIGTVAQFGNRSLRALAVGAPTVGVLQVGLGSGRPYTHDSHWAFLDHKNGASGHAFVGAVPFLTAASMTESRLLKAVLIAGSLGPAWSRIQTDDHYFSQVLLGWTIAYLSVESVNLTECRARNMRIVPVELPQGVGLGVQFEY